MASYRDDSNDTAVAGSSTWLGLRAIVEGTARASSVIVSALFVLHAGTAVASDAVIDRTLHVMEDGAASSDLASDHALIRTRVIDTARAGDALLDRVLHVIADAAQVTDFVGQGLRDIVREAVPVSDSVLHQRRAADSRGDQARASDRVLSVARSLVVDAALAADWAGGRAKGRLVSVDSAALADAVFDARQAAAAFLSDGATATGAPFGVLRAADLVGDAAMADGLPMQSGAFGQAWTCNTGTWPMSRYAPFTFTSLAVIDGVVYAAGEGGVFALDGEQEDMAAVLRTGKLDVTRGTLVRLVEAPMEYELDGLATLDVTETQNGAAPETYTYQPDARQALERTNTRFQLGRGLKGRHFTFALGLHGKRAHINDLRLTVAPSKRSM
ncbi:hypothetical protein HNP48_002244 [Acidovorax soli]|uniref:Uncharacterized protein n=1 Tax=Acidovorax soli TaxID=592050 RepID=A0A7X0U8T5_9BURK|nr:hypothetical protein [Acidovorax soli]MBB6559577.1 hypothetical protein [Acidovorax soli]